MTAPFQLRGYQAEAVEAIIAARKQGNRRLLVALPTGAGKTVIFAELIRRAKHGVLVLAHRKELLSQAAEKIEAALARDPSGPRRVVAVEQGQQRAPKAASIIIASLRSLHAGRMGSALAGRDIRLVIYDECHHAVAEENKRVLERLGAFEADWPGTLVGFTATTRRADGQALAEVFEKIVYARSLRDMISDGYLRPLRGLRISTKVDLSELPCLGASRDGEEAGDFELDSLEERVDIESRNLVVARAIQEYARDRRTIAFCVGVGHAENLARTLNHLGLRAAMVCGEMPMAARTKTLADFRGGQVRVLTNVGVLTEGFDDPGVSAVAMVRPTRSEAMYLQCIGRGMRLDPSAKDCLILDFVDLGRLELVTLPTLLGSERPGGGEMPDDDRENGSAFRPEADDVGPEAPLTLSQIHERTAGFDPLVPEQRQELAAISNFAWVSMGGRGLFLIFRTSKGRFRRFDLRSAGGQRYSIVLDGEELSRMTHLNVCVDAVEHELPRYGDASSALPDAPWRHSAVDDQRRAQLDKLHPPRLARNLGEAIEHLALAAFLGL